MSPDAAVSRSGAPNWRAILIAVCISQATAIIGFDFTLPFVPLYLQHDLGIHGLGRVALWSGLIAFGPAIPATIFGPMWGKLADRFGYRTMLLRAMLSAALLLGLMGFAPNAPVLLVLRMIQGALTGTVFASQALVAASAPERETGRAMGLLQMSVFIGATFGPVGGGAAASIFGFRPAYMMAGALIGIATLVVFFFVREPARRPTIEAAERPSATSPSMLSLLSARPFATAIGLTLVVQLAANAILPVIPLFVQNLVHSAALAPTDTGWLMAIAGLTAGGGSYLAGRLQRHMGIKPILVVCLVLSALLVTSQSLSGNYLAFVALRACAAFAFGGLVSMVGTLAATESPREAKGAAFGLMGAASSMGFGAGPLIGGSLVAAIGIRSVFVLSGVSLLVLPLVMLAVQRVPGGVRALRPAVRRG